MWPSRKSWPARATADRWPVHGTSGYDFLNLVGGLFVASDRSDRHAGVPGLLRRKSACSTTRLQKKRLIMNASLASELHMHPISSIDWHKARDGLATSPPTPCSSTSRMIACFPSIGPISRRRGGRGGSPLRRGGRPPCQDPQPASERAVFRFIRDMLLGIVRFVDRRRPRRTAPLRRQVPASSPRRSQRRESRTRPFTSTTGWSRSTKSAETPAEFGIRPEACTRTASDRQAQWP